PRAVQLAGRRDELEDLALVALARLLQANLAHRQSRFSSPTTGERSSDPTLRTASRTPGMNDSREIESCRTESVCPTPPKMTSWCATRPGRRTEWIGSWGLPPAS